MDKAKQIYKKYTDNMRFITIIGYVLYLVLCLFLISALLFPLAVALVVPMLLILRKLKLIKFRKHILGVILDDLYAPLYREVIKSSGIGTRNIFWDIQRFSRLKPNAIREKLEKQMRIQQTTKILFEVTDETSDLSFFKLQIPLYKFPKLLSSFL